VPSTVTVTVLNGTTVPNLAHSIAAELATGGFKQGAAPTNASDQSETATQVGYVSGHRVAALAVAKYLKLGSTSVQPVSPSDETVACGGSTTSCPDDVVVTVGTDLVSSSTTT